MITREQKAEFYSQDKVWVKTQNDGWVLGEPRYHNECTEGFGVTIDKCCLWGSEYSLTEPKKDIEPGTLCRVETVSVCIFVVIIKETLEWYTDSNGLQWGKVEPILIDGKPVIIPEDQRPNN